MDKLKFALVGCGRIAERHAEQIKRLGLLIAVCDKAKSRVDRLGKLYGSKIYTDYDVLLASEKDIDIVSICTPNGLHAEQSIKAFRNGVHVLCEKPMAISVYDCGEMIKEA